MYNEICILMVLITQTAQNSHTGGFSRSGYIMWMSWLLQQQTIVWSLFDIKDIYKLLGAIYCYHSSTSSLVFIFHIFGSIFYHIHISYFHIFGSIIMSNYKVWHCACALPEACIALCSIKKKSTSSFNTVAIIIAQNHISIDAGGRLPQGGKLCWHGSKVLFEPGRNVLTTMVHIGFVSLGDAVQLDVNITCIFDHLSMFRNWRNNVAIKTWSYSHYQGQI